MASKDKKIRKIYFRSPEELPQTLSRVVNYVLEQKIDVKEAQFILSAVRTYLQVLEYQDEKTDIEFIKAELERIKEEGLL